MMDVGADMLGMVFSCQETTTYRATEQAMKAMISVATNSFDDLVYFMFSPGKKNSLTMEGKWGITWQCIRTQ